MSDGHHLIVSLGALTRLVPGNTAENVSTIRLESHQPKALDNRTLRKLLRVTRSHPRDYAMLEMLAGTGLRVGELLMLKVGDVELKARSGQVIVRRGKYENYREVPLTLDVRKALDVFGSLSSRARQPQSAALDRNPRWIESPQFGDTDAGEVRPPGGD